jgi:hypothetical protein
MKRHFFVLLACLPLATAALPARRANAQGPQLPGLENTASDAKNGDVVPPEPPRFVTPPEQPAAPPRGLDPQPQLKADDFRRASPRAPGYAPPGDAPTRSLPPGQTNRRNPQPGMIRSAPSGRRPSTTTQPRPATTPNDAADPWSSGAANRRAPQPSILPSPGRAQARPAAPQQLPRAGDDPYEVRANRRTPPPTNAQDEMRRRWYQPWGHQGTGKSADGQAPNPRPQSGPTTSPQTRANGGAQQPYYAPAPRQSAPYYRGAPQPFTPREQGRTGPQLNWEPRQSSLDRDWPGSMGAEPRGGLLRNDPRPPWEAQPRARR